MKYLIFFLLFYSPALFAKDYQVKIQAGDKLTTYQVLLNEKKQVLSVHSSRKKSFTLFNKENSQTLLKKIKAVFKEKSNKKEHCPREHITLSSGKDVRLACIGSRTKVAEKSAELVNALKLTEMYK